MPFQTRLLSEPLPGPEPDVNIFFHGQLLARSAADGASCQVGVNPLANNHVLSIEARTKTRGKPDVIQMRHFGKLSAVEPQGMTIEVSPQVSQPVVWKCVAETEIDYETGTGAPNEDFRWMLNLEGSQFHNRELNPAIFETHSVITLRGGEYFFQTALRSGEGWRFDRTEGGEPTLTFRKIGAVLGVQVFLVEDQSVVITWNDGTEKCVLTLTKSEQGSTHEIYVENTPLYQQPPAPGIATHHGELVEYYKVISEIPLAERFDLIPVKENGFNEAGSPTIPCQVVVLDGPPT